MLPACASAVKHMLSTGVHQVALRLYHIWEVWSIKIDFVWPIADIGRENGQWPTVISGTAYMSASNLLSSWEMYLLVGQLLTPPISYKYKRYHCHSSCMYYNM